MKKKPLYLLLSVVLMISLFPFTIQAEEFTSGSDALPDIIPNGVFSWEGDQAEKDSEVSVSMRELPFYIGSLEVTFDLPVYYVNGTDIPYMNLENWADVMVTLMQEGMGDMEYGLFIETDEELAQYTRENQYSVLFDFKEGTITFEDFDEFTHSAADTFLIDILGDDIVDGDGNPILIEKVNKGSFDRYGKELEISLSDYDIPVYYVKEDELYLVPLQTLGDLFTALPTRFITLYNENGVYITPPYLLGSALEALTEYINQLF